MDRERLSEARDKRRLDPLADRVAIFRPDAIDSSREMWVPGATVAALLDHTSTATLHKHDSHLTSRAEVLREAANRVRGGGAG